MADVTVETGGLTVVQQQIAHAIMALLEGFEFTDALTAILAVLAGCIDEGSEDAREAVALAEALGDALADLVGKAG
ncbi:MAG TPA: hypothetical protein VL202_00340 [Pararhizobium sp.]|uniref:hypothetical protein n=1 Tax=Pararhizobium sp. TaxID=1977563 RepID=UPI002CFD4742|nr:hypothetical protein [Pararhizobium sp.]HTO29618.1 hypothetical protein [Pararhizobium sp.]